MADNKGSNVSSSNIGRKSINDRGIGHNPPPPPQSVRPGFPGGKSK